MANPGSSVGNKFVSVNLNKSYGQPRSSSSNTGRIRPVNHVSVGGGGMVVLSRTRSTISGGPKGSPKLSVPPPLNLPSLRKEHERLDLSTSGGLAGGGNAGSGAGLSSSTMGWTKPGISATLQEKDVGQDQPMFGRPGSGGQTVNSPVDGEARVSSSIYMPPSARSGMGVQQPVAATARDVLPVEKAVVLRGEDFPSLHATLSSATMQAQKQKDGVNQKQKQRPGEDALNEKMESSNLRSPLHMRPQLGSTRLTANSNSGESRGSGGLPGGMGEPSRKQDGYLPGPLPLVRLSHTSDWADDERDTGHGIPDRNRDHGFLRAESGHERDFDIPRSALPRSLVQNLSEGQGPRDAEASKISSREVLKGESFGRDVRTPSREGRDGSSWRVSSLPKDGFGAREIGIDRNGVTARPFSLSKDAGKDNKFGDNARDGFSSMANGNQDARYMRRDLGYGPSGQNGNHSAESFNGRGTEQNTRGRYGDASNRYRGDVFQNSLKPKSSFSLGSKGLPMNDPILNFGREKHLFSGAGKPYVEDTFLKDFDGRDPFSGGFVGDVKVFKRKKDVLKQADFHDPVRESFEAELERVQKMQEQERRQIAEEQARAMELARKEEEERQRLAREEEERRRRLEEEAREAAWRAEQERLEAVKRAEEQKMAREEEKRRIHLEEERRKEAARKKLLELEARIAKRQSEATNTKDDKFTTFMGDERMPGLVKEREVPRLADVGDWEDGERMVERITSSASSDSSSMNRHFETGSRPHSSRDGNPAFSDRGKHSNSWKRDVFENGNNSSFLLQDQDNGYHSPRRDAVGVGRVFPRKDFYGGPGVMSSRTSTKVGMPEPHMPDDFPHLRGRRWNLAVDGDHYGRNSDIDSEFPDNSMDKFTDIGWGQGRSRSSSHAPYAERLFQNSEVDGFSSFGRMRHSMRQPRVLPPPSLPSMHRGSFRADTEHPGSSGFMANELRYQQAGYGSAYHENLGQPGMRASAQEDASPQEQKEEKNVSGCDSQSSLSVSSPPNSPTHLSHDDLDDCGDSPHVAAVDDGEQIALSDNEHVISASEAGNTNIVIAPRVASPVEDEEWAAGDNEELQEQEEYDEVEDGYREEDEVHDDENLDLTQEFEDLHSEEQDTSGKVSQLVLGFDEGVEVGMPSGDELERTPRKSENAVGRQPLSAVTSHELESFDGHGLPSENNFPELSLESASKMIQETEKSLQDLVIQPVNASASSAACTNYLPDTVEATNNSGLLGQQPVTSSVNMSLPSQQIQPILSTVSSVSSQSEVSPVKLQFGLFSGPSLIPSPVPAIQIGSIQMPLHLHPQVGPSLSQIHPSQSPVFQFGQLRYTSPISQGILPLAPQTVPFVQPTVSTHYSMNQNPAGSLQNQATQDSSIQSPGLKDNMPSVLMDNQPGFAPNLMNSSQENLGKEVNGLLVTGNANNDVLPSQNRESSLCSENKPRSESISQVENQGHRDKTVKRNYRSFANNGDTQGLMHTEATSSHPFSKERNFAGSKAPGPIPGSRGRRLVYTVRNNGSRLSFPASEASRVDSSGFQRKARRNIRRTEFRVRENVDGRQLEGVASSNHPGQDEKSNISGRVSGSSRSGGKKDAGLNKSTKPAVDSECFLTSGSSSSRVADSENKTDKALGNTAANTSRSGDGILKTNGNSEEDVDAPLQSGVVRVFKQPGIEAASDEDDFIEVRSKRQMLNDRREQREKEIKAKSRVIKAPRKPRSISQSIVVSSNSNRVATSLSGEMTNSARPECVVTDGKGPNNAEVSSGFSTSIASPPLPPIGTPAVTADAQPDTRSLSMKSHPTNSVPANLVPGLSFESKNVDNVPTLGPWANARINQQVMVLAQTKLDEAMKPGRFDTHVASIGDHTVVAMEPGKQSTSVLTQDISFTSSASPLNSLLAGEKIQFGAVTSPTILPPSSRAVSSGIGPPGLCRSDISSSTDHNLSGPEGDCTLFFDKGKHPDGSCIHLEDPEAEAEAAASAVAVAAISSDELVGTGLGACSVSVSETKSFGGPDVVGLPSGGVADNQQLSCQSRGEESLTVALPADLSVETPSLSLWPTLPSPQNSSGPMLSHFPGAPPSHFPCYEMNPMLGGPIFAFGPHDESASTQSQSQKTSTSGTGPLGAWQQCHSGVDSFYGHPAGFTAPFISPPGGMPGVQGPPHMVVYNHFAPVGQYGQLGLSFMGTTYIPSGKQPDWKHTPVSSAVGISEGDINNLNMVSGQRNPSGMPAPIQHLAPGSPLLPMASPLAMFDMPFQSSAEIPVQARWSHVPASPLHSIPPSMPLQKQAEGGLPSQFNHGLPVESSTGKRFHEPRSSAPADNCRNFHVAADSSQLPDELGLVDPSSTGAPHAPTSRPASYSATNGNNKVQSLTKSSSRSTVGSANESSLGGGGSSSSSSQSMSSSFKNQPTQQYLHPIGYTDQRGGLSHKIGSGGEWHHRRMGFQGRNQTSGTDKNFAVSKMKQIYVAKPATSGTPTTNV
ncbi:uncharacterized protein LOC131236331 isoform X2 [Magnolia sinica]|uniref:uncharacterized protein LOC131236331 isoform X2 n=1 Tax=Magnolia sinica TaxID=86752 RepID=UPI00265805EE|nr:uncharacterized protein LOC131236331 isoform X2 [Magnolia sinica]